MGILRPTLTLLLVSVLFATSDGAANDSDPQNYRLEDSVQPKHYEIFIKPMFNGKDFDSFIGNVTITVDVKDKVEVFRIHVGCNIEVDTSSLGIRHDGNEIEGVTIEKHAGYGDCVNNIQGDEEGNDFYVITLSEPLLKPQSENLEIFLAYNAKFPPGMYGFYKSYYTDEEGKEQVLLTTQFETTHARKAFPCFDEPGFKAQFTLTFEVPRGYHVISNAKEVDSDVYDDEAETHVVSFKKSTKMSTYLVAFIVYHSDTFIKTPEGNDTYSTSTWGRKPEIDEGAGDLSQEYVPLILDSIGNYTGISYLLTELEEEVMPNKPEKVDQAAIPDFSAGAMENWGLVTYRETALLYKEGKHSETAKKRVVEVIAHELAHHWFGNLVTTKWWNSAWLNEGFATLFECYLTEDVTHGDWRVMERFIADDQIKALGVDAYDSAPPLTIDKDKLLTGSQASNHFGTITYSKGGSVLRMFQNMIGPDKFREAVQEYLKEMAGRAAEPADLFKALNNVKRDNLTDVFERWTTRSGFPLITVDEGENGITVSQKRYLIGKQDNETKYDVQISLSVNSEEDQECWLHFDDTNTCENLSGPQDKWLLVKTTGFFRVKYSDKNWKLLVAELESGNMTKIEPVERAVLVDNALNLARFGELDYSVAIDVLNYLTKENDFIPWYTASIELNFLHRMLVNSEQDQGGTINKYIRGLIDQVYKHFQENNDDHIAKVHRANIFNWACRVGHETCLKEVRDAFQNYITGSKSDVVDPDIINTVYCYGVQTNDTAWVQLWSKLYEENDAIIRSVIISALGCSKNQIILTLYLDMGILQSAIRAQDAPAVFSSVYSNPDGIEVALQFLETKIKRVQENVETVMNGLANMISGIAQYLTTESQKDRMKAIGETSDSVKTYVETAVNTIQSNMEWKNKHEKNVLKLLQEKMTEGSAGAKQPAVIMLTLTFIICVFLL